MPLTVREQKALQPKRRNKKKTELVRPINESRRKFLLSPEHKARLAAGVAKYRAANGGKVATRKGVPDGWAGPRRRLRKQLIAEAETKGKMIVDELVENGLVKRDEAGNKVLAWAAGVVLAKDPVKGDACYPIREQLAAAKMVLDFTLTKPESKQSVTVTAENFLAGILAKSNGSSESEETA